MANVAKNLKSLRQEKELTQEALSERLHVTRQTVSSWETGRTQPDVDMLLALSSALDTDVETLIYGKKNRVGLEADETGRRKTLTTVLTVMGLLFFAAGLILVFVFFWRKIPDLTRRALAFLPFVVGTGAGLAVLITKKGSLFFREGAAVLWTAGLFASVFLVNGVFKAEGDFGLLLLCIIALTLPFCFLFDSIFSFSFSLLAITGDAAYFIFGDAGRELTFLRGAGAWVLVVLLCCLPLVPVFWLLRRETDPARRRFGAALALLAAVTLGVFVGGVLSHGFSYRVVTAQVLVFAMCLFLAERTKKTDLPLRIPACIVFGVTFFIAAVVFTVGEGNIDFPDLTAISSVVFILMVLFLCLSFFYGRAGRKAERETRRLRLGFLIVMALSVLSVLLIWDGDLKIYLLLPFLSMVYGVLTVVSGVKRASISRANAGIVNISAAFIVLIAALFEGNVLLLGLAALAVGAALLLSNRAMVRRFKKRTAPAEEALPSEVNGEEAEDHA